MFLVEAVNAASTNDQRRDLQARPDVQAASSLWAKQPLVAGEAEDVHAQRSHVDRARTCGLSCINNEQQTVLFCEVCDKIKVGDIAGHVGRMSDDDGTGVRAAFLLELLIPQNTPCVRLDKIKLYTVLFQEIERTQDGIVFAEGRDDMIARMEQTAKRGVQALGSVGCERNV